jgi:hypothetical protein
MKLAPVVAIGLGLLEVPAQAAPPVVFFTDLLSGPNTGGEGNSGTIVTLYGKNFGALQGTVTIGGGAAARYYEWGTTAITETGLEKIAVAIGPMARTGAVVVTASNGTSNADVLFTVRSGNVFFVSTSGDDTQDGSFAHPWRTITKARDVLAAGDTAYIMDGVTQSTLDDYGACLVINAGNSGAPGAPKAIVAYPGARATIGLTSARAPAGIQFAMRVDEDPPFAASHWVFAGLRYIGPLIGVHYLGDDVRFIGNDITCPNADPTEEACFETSGATHFKFLGNYEHDSGPVGFIDKQLHSVYFSTDSNHIEVGWNAIVNDTTFRSLQFHSSPLNGGGPNDPTGHNQFDLHVHDNLIHDNPGDGINFATVDPSQGTVEAYNNIIYNVGTSDPQGGGGAFNCIYVAGITNTGPVGGGVVQIYNNTFANCGSNNSANAQGGRGVVSYGDNDGSGALRIALTNNIAYQSQGEEYVNGVVANISGRNNLWFGAGPGPTSGFTNDVAADPTFVSASAHDYHLQPSSMAVAGGTSTPAASLDFDGVVRPAPPSIGAYEPTPSCAPCPDAGGSDATLASDGGHADSSANPDATAMGADSNVSGSDATPGGPDASIFGSDAQPCGATCADAGSQRSVDAEVGADSALGTDAGAHTTLKGGCACTSARTGSRHDGFLGIAFLLGLAGRFARSRTARRSAASMESVL